MTRYEILKLNLSFITFMLRNNISAGDIAYFDIYERYESMRKKGFKVSYIISCIAGEKKMTERTVYNIIGRMGKRVEKV